jgi:hypothetical protein
MDEQSVKTDLNVPSDRVLQRRRVQKNDVIKAKGV